MTLDLPFLEKKTITTPSRCQFPVIEDWVHDGVATRKIYARAYRGNYSSGGIMTLKNLLMEQGIVTCAQLSEKPELFKNLGLSQEKQQWVANELKEIE